MPHSSTPSTAQAPTTSIDPSSDRHDIPDDQDRDHRRVCPPGRATSQVVESHRVSLSNGGTASSGSDGQSSSQVQDTFAAQDDSVECCVSEEVRLGQVLPRTPGSLVGTRDHSYPSEKGNPNLARSARLRERIQSDSAPTRLSATRRSR